MDLIPSPSLLLSDSLKHEHTVSGELFYQATVHCCIKPTIDEYRIDIE